MNKIIRRFFLPVTLTLGTIGVANANINEDCPSPLKVTPKVVWFADQVKVHTNYTVRNLMQIKKESYDSNKPFSATLGMYIGNRTIKISPKISKTTITQGRYRKVCYSVEDLVVEIAYKPEIYLALEAMQFHCTKSRVYEHELKHHNVDVLALNRVPEYMKTHGMRHLNKINALSDDGERQQREIEILLNRTIDDLGKYLDVHTKPHHSQMDTESNYEKEMNYCSKEENIKLMTMIKNGGNPQNVSVYDRFR